MDKQPKNVLMLAIISLIVVFAAAMFLKTDTGRKITGIDIGGMFSDADQKKLKKSNKKIQDRYIVVLKNNTQDVGAVADELAAATTGEVKLKYDKVLKGFAAKLPEAQVQKLLDDERVEYVEEDAELLPATTTQAGATLGLDRIDQRALPLNGTYNYDATGEGVNAYIIDSGIRTTHADFGGRAYFAANFTEDPDGTDCTGHGTHIAGTIGSNTYGVAKRAKLYSLKVTNCANYSTTSGLIGAINWITANKGSAPSVANISLTLSGSSLSLDTSINNSIASGVTYAIAAGNFGMNACAYSPARVTNAITVGSMVPADMDSDGDFDTDYRMGYSNIGSCLDLFAPGNGIYSLSSADDTSSKMMNGTSMAAPHVAGVAALYLETHRSASASEVRNAIVSSATTGTITGIDSTTPNKVLYSFVTQGAQDDPPPPPPPPPPGTPPVATCAGTTYTGSVAAGAINYHTSAGFSGRAGAYSGTLTSSNGGQAALVLERKQGKTWIPQSTATGATGTLNLAYNGTKGSYRWKVVGTTATNYSLCSKLP